MESRDKIREFIDRTFLFGSKDAKLADGDSFLETGIIDSTGMLELVSFIEGEFGIEVGDTELIPENLDSIDRLAGFIEKKKVGTAS